MIAVQPRLERLLAEANRRRLEVAEPVDLAVAGLLFIAGLVLALASASSGPVVVVFVLGFLMLGKVGLRRWQPSKDPADYV